jgi:hypothetical protein
MNQNLNLRITLKWIPGHKGVEGNEQADEQAKKAITDGSSANNQIPAYLHNPIPQSKSATTQNFNVKLKIQAQKEWVKSPRYNRMKKTDPNNPSNAFLKLTEQLPRKLTSILTQLRTGHAPLESTCIVSKEQTHPCAPHAYRGRKPYNISCYTAQLTKQPGSSCDTKPEAAISTYRKYSPLLSTFVPYSDILLKLGVSILT